jgi:phage tail-like protein
MPAIRDFALVQSEIQWRMAVHDRTSLGCDPWHVQLAWTQEGRRDLPPSEPSGESQPEVPVPAGLAFDPWCRLYRSVPQRGQVERVLWAAPGSFRFDRAQATVVDLLALPSEETSGDFVRDPNVPVGGGGRPVPLQSPRGLAVDNDGNLFVAEHGAARILVYDLRERRLLRRVPLCYANVPLRPLDMACDGRRVYVLLESDAGAPAEVPRLAVLEAHTGPVPYHLPCEERDIQRATQVDLCKAGYPFVIVDGGTESVRIVPLVPKEWRLSSWEVPYATDLAFLSNNDLVVARRPGEDFRCFAVSREGAQEQPPYSAYGYQGRGIVRTPDDRIVYETSQGLHHAVRARVRYQARGYVTTLGLDSGVFQTTWGRLFVDACIPAGAEVRLCCVTADEPSKLEVLSPQPPQQSPPESGEESMPAPDSWPPAPPRSCRPVPDAPLAQTIYCRPSGCELPWTQRPENGYRTYEAPIRAAPGRYLWVTLELTGNTYNTPRVKCLRAEYPSHDLLRHLPRVYARDVHEADFLRRYLTGMEGILAELDARAFARHALLDPHSTPAELLPWLAGFVGLTCDERWPVPTRRRLIERAIPLFRARGTLSGLREFLEIVVGPPVILVEHFRVRGLGGALVPGEEDLTSRAVLGAGLRVGGTLGVAGETALSGTTVDERSDRRAHRFSVLVPRRLTDEQREMVYHILDRHRPAHTICDLCTVDSGMRVGMGLYVELSTIVGQSGGFDTLQLGRSLLGRRDIMGRPRAGVDVGNSALGYDSRSG